MKKLFEMSQEHLIKCDNIECDYSVKNETRDPNVDIFSYVNKACPTCGENLLTEQDYNTGVIFMKIVNWLNKWFSWTTIFMKKEFKEVTVQFNEGVKMEDKK